MSGSNNTPREVKRAEGEVRGPVLDVLLRRLLEAGEHEKVVGLVSQLLLRNGELEKKLARRKEGAGNEAEGLSSDQLELSLRAIQQQAEQGLQQANDKLGEASKAPAKPEPTSKPPRQPTVRRPHLR